ncbi:unnamed protein product, partial [Rotaria sp. Silwood1]
MARTTTDDSTTSQILCNNVERQKNTVLCECKICGALARYSYYGAIVCHSCKIFFKRNAAVLKCYFDNDCNININNRHTCASCRLAKCFDIGMSIEMIRSFRYMKNDKKEEKKLTGASNPSAPTTSMIINKKHMPEQ